MNDYVSSTLEIIKHQFEEIVNADSFYADYKNNIEISDEQLFAKKTDDDLIHDHIYIVIKFTPASVDFGQVILPITINAVSERNGIEICQKLLFDFASIYTQRTLQDDDDYVKELWNSPNVLSNFNEVDFGFRSLFYMTGTLLIGKNSDPIEELIYFADTTITDPYERGEDEEIIYRPNGRPMYKSGIVDLFETMITYSDSFDVQLDPQPFYSTNAINKSKAKTASWGFGITCFKTINDFMKKCKKIKRGIINSQNPSTANGIDERFQIAMKDKDDDELWKVDCRMVNYTLQQNKGDLPTVSLTFAR